MHFEFELVWLRVRVRVRVRRLSWRKLMQTTSGMCFQERDLDIYIERERERE